MERLTVLIAASLVPSHPRTDLVEQVLDSVRHVRTVRPLDVIVCHDPPRPDATSRDRRRFDEYIGRLERLAVQRGDFRVTVADRWGHLVGNLRHVLEQVETEFMLVLQHDWMLVEPLPIDDLITMMTRHPEVRHLRFNRHPNLPVHWDGKRPERVEFFEEVELDGQRLCRTLAWSDIPHLCRVDYYRDVILPIVGDRQTFPEFVCDPLSVPRTHELFGTYLYGPYGREPTSVHLDGRFAGQPLLGRVARTLTLQSKARRKQLRVLRSRLRLRTRLRALLRTGSLRG